MPGGIRWGQGIITLFRIPQACALRAGSRRRGLSLRLIGMSCPPGATGRPSAVVAAELDPVGGDAVCTGVPSGLALDPPAVSAVEVLPVLGGAPSISRAAGTCWGLRSRGWRICWCCPCVPSIPGLQVVEKLFHRDELGHLFCRPSDSLAFKPFQPIQCMPLGYPCLQCWFARRRERCLWKAAAWVTPLAKSSMYLGSPVSLSPSGCQKTLLGRSSLCLCLSTGRIAELCQRAGHPSRRWSGWPYSRAEPAAGSS